MYYHYCMVKKFYFYEIFPCQQFYQEFTILRLWYQLVGMVAGNGKCKGILLEETKHYLCYRNRSFAEGKRAESHWNPGITWR